MTNDQFSPGQTYENAFLIFVDSAGHSSIVAANPRDRAARAFDLLQERAVSRLTGLAADYRCRRAQLWRWAGDGGFLVVHDDNESIARDVVLSYARSLVELDLRHLRDEFAQLGIAGELHLRIAVHRGTIQYRGIGLEGSIYSPDINFAAHLEKVAPVDTVTISADVHRVAGRDADLFELVGTHEGREVYVYASGGRPGDGVRAWLAGQGLTGGGSVFGYPQRPNQIEKARLVRAAINEVVDLGSALRTAAHYFVTTERPAYFRDAALEFLARGGRYRCVLMDPDCDATRVLSLQREEDIAGKIKQSLANFRRFKERAGSLAEGLEVYQTSSAATMGCLAIDLDEPHALLLASPYLSTPAEWGGQIELSELPHFLVGRSTGQLFTNLRRMVTTFISNGVERVV